MGRLAYRAVVHTEVVPDGAHHDLSRVEPDAYLDDDAMTAEDFVGVTSHAFLHAQRRITSAHSVVLVGHRRAEEGHDPVAHHLVHRALVAVDGLHHPFEHGIENLARLFRGHDRPAAPSSP